MFDLVSDSYSDDDSKSFSEAARKGGLFFFYVKQPFQAVYYRLSSLVYLKQPLFLFGFDHVCLAALNLAMRSRISFLFAASGGAIFR